MNRVFSDYQRVPPKYESYCETPKYEKKNENRSTKVNAVLCILCRLMQFMYLGYLR